MPKFPVDAPQARVIKSLERLGFRLVRTGNHIAMERQNADGTRTPLTMPNHRTHYQGINIAHDFDTGRHFAR